MTPLAAAFFALILCGRAVPASAQVLDRIAAVVNGKFLITLSDIRKERSVLAALGKEAGTDTAIRQGLIDRYLVEEQIAQFPGIEASEAEVERRLAQIKETKGVTREELRRAVTAEIRLSDFVIQRFQQFIRVSEAEVEDYYQKVVIPAAKKNNNSVPPLENLAGEIRRAVAGLKLDNELMTWLDDLRRRNDVETFD
jgi:parvulin-like peptidyl-prolyl isomerase